MDNIIYFSFNNWFSGRDYPEGDKYDWMIYSAQLSSEKYAKENKLVVVTGYIDMSLNWCVAAPRKYVEENLPELLTDEEYTYDIISYSNGENTKTTYTKKYSDFVYPCGEDGEAPYECRYGMPFKEYDEEAIGVHWVEEDEWEEPDEWEDLEEKEENE